MVVYKSKLCTSNTQQYNLLFIPTCRYIAVVFTNVHKHLMLFLIHYKPCPSIVCRDLCGGCKHHQKVNTQYNYQFFTLLFPAVHRKNPETAESTSNRPISNPITGLDRP